MSSRKVSDPISPAVDTVVSPADSAVNDIKIKLAAMVEGLRKTSGSNNPEAQAVFQTFKVFTRLLTVAKVEEVPMLISKMDEVLEPL